VIEVPAAPQAPVNVGPAPVPQQESPAPAPVANPVTAVVPVAPAPVAKRSSSIVLGDKIPDYEDIILPRLNIAQNIGELGDTFDPGSVVYNQATLLFNPPIVDKAGVISKAGLPPFNIVCLGFRPTRFVEKVKGGGRGLIVNTEAEVTANGGTLDFQEWKLKEKDGMKKFDQLAEALIAIERPAHLADDDSVFVYAVDGKKYAIALWAMKSTAFTEAAKKVFFTNRSVGCLSKGYPTRQFAMSTRWKTYPGNNGAWIPVLIPGAPTTPAFLAWVESVLNPTQVDSSAE
jgi:hypothetical protein